MAWMTTTDVDRWLIETGHLLESDVVANNALLTEARFWSSLPERPGEGLFGWWVEGRATQAAFLHVPEHPMICSPLTQRSAAALPDAAPGVESVGVEETDADAVVGAFASRGRELRPAAGMTLLRLRPPVRPRPFPDGHWRPADRRDLPRLHAWFGQFQQRHPEDRSHVAFVIDQPLGDGGVVLWERRGRPVAMASRTPRTAGMVRMGLAFQPRSGDAYAAAAFDAACVDAARTTQTVLVLSRTVEDTTTYMSLGFKPVLKRVVLRRA